MPVRPRPPMSQDPDRRLTNLARLTWVVGVLGCLLIVASVFSAASVSRMQRNAWARARAEQPG